VRGEERRPVFLLTPPLLTPHFLQPQPTDAAFVGIAGLAGAGEVAMLLLATDVLSSVAQTACSLHDVTVKVAAPPRQAHVPLFGVVGLLVQLGREHDVDSQVPELLPHVATW
jgi:hypothetical protein